MPIRTPKYTTGVLWSFKTVGHINSTVVSVPDPTDAAADGLHRLIEVM